MNPFAFISLTSAIISLVLAALVYASNPKSKINRFFALTCILMAYTAFAEYSLRQSHNAAEALVWAKVDVLWPLTMVVILHFALAYTEQWKILSKRRALVLIYVPAVCFTVVVTTTNYLTSGIKQSWWGWANESQFNATTLITNIWFISMVVLIGFIMWRYYIKQKDHSKKHLAKYIAIGYTIPSLVGMLTGLLSPLMSIQIPDLTVSAWTIGGLFIWYGIWKYRLFTVEPSMAAENILDTMSDLLFLTDLNGKIMTVNRAAMETIGYRQEELVGNELRAYFPNADITMNTIQKMRSSDFKEAKDYQATLQSKSGKIIPVSISPSLLQHEHGKRIGYLFIARDITTRQKMEDKIRKLNSAMEQASDGIVIFSTTDREISYANDAFSQMLGYSRQELIGTQIKQHINRFLNDEAKTLGDLLTMAGNSPQTSEIEQIRKDGYLFPSLASFAYIKNELGHTTNVVAVIKDITEDKIVNEQLVAQAKELEKMNIHLQEADRLKSIFLASMSHELRTPLNAVIGFTGIMLQGLTGEINDEQRQQLTMVKSSADHLLSLINDVLDISKLEAGKFELITDDLKLDDILTEVLNTVSPMANLKQLPINTDIQKAICLNNDSRRIKQILINLLSNAIKFTQKGSIKLSARVKNETTLEFKVKDTGAGITDEDLKRLFQPFQQVNTDLTKSQDGTGLGLYLSRKLAKLMGGDITVSSQYGQGSEFVFTLQSDSIKIDKCEIATVTV